MSTHSFPELPEGYRFFVKSTETKVERTLTPEEKKYAKSMESYHEKQKYLYVFYPAVAVTIQKRYDKESYEVQPRRWWQIKERRAWVTRDAWLSEFVTDPILVEDVTPATLSDAGAKLLVQLNDSLERDRQIEYTNTLLGAYPPLKLEDQDDRPHGGTE